MMQPPFDPHRATRMAGMLHRAACGAKVLHSTRLGSRSQGAISATRPQISSTTGPFLSQGSWYRDVGPPERIPRHAKTPLLTDGHDHCPFRVPKNTSM